MSIYEDYHSDSSEIACSLSGSVIVELLVRCDEGDY